VTVQLLAQALLASSYVLILLRLLLSLLLVPLLLLFLLLLLPLLWLTSARQQHVQHRSRAVHAQQQTTRLLGLAQEQASRRQRGVQCACS